MEKKLYVCTFMRIMGSDCMMFVWLYSQWMWEYEKCKLFGIVGGLVFCLLLIIVAIVLALTLTGDDSSAAAQTTETVITMETDIGWIRGNVLVDSGVEMFAFAGIPYCEAPVGDKRFAPCLPLNTLPDNNQSAPFDATGIALSYLLYPLIDINRHQHMYVP